MVLNTLETLRVTIGIKSNRKVFPTARIYYIQKNETSQFIYILNFYNKLNAII